MWNIINLSCRCNNTKSHIKLWTSTIFHRSFSEELEFRVLNLKTTRTQQSARKRLQKPDVLPPRTNKMPIDQDWGNVWPGPRSFHPATVPLPIRQGFTQKKAAPPSKYANAELMKIPNFLHLTPPVIKRQCESLKRFCTPWPQGLETDDKCEKYFPLHTASSSYCYSSPSIRDPLARIVTLQLKLSSLQLNEHAKDKFRRIVGDRYNEENDVVTIVADRCPLRQQNYDYAMYLLTAVYHESWNVEEWEKNKSDLDMEIYDWNVSRSKKNIESIFAKSSNEILKSDVYSNAVTSLMNEGENDYTVSKYGEAVRELLQLPP
ncbi:hypothetical protein PPYR_10611 [Photinus pyralis]|uniref:Small ribosomal subunit protein mS35 mitochondrial conserved domain-containing protein n=1 Tax=Photinus pyralis TaxID=7054 RepID=A0A1Y1NCL6_PHOPY|nr:28S ribosomal protein S35, mitochondrial [Photinus pyralis]KAB0796550.1 hypothetical protein PPYR_10611 [Photinus pyralis]